jgi:perosamine synthetase
MKVPFFNSYVDDNAIELVNKTLKSTFLSEGPVVAQFESELESQLSILNPVAVNSGTSSLHLALVLANVSNGDEVILPSQTFVASALAVLYVGAKPVFADINYEDGNINIKSLEEKITKKTKAIMPVHWSGYPCDMNAINKIAKKQNLKVIEDAAHALGSFYHSKSIGTISDFTCFSFQAIKHLTTGDGGLIGCKYKRDAKRAKKLRWFGIDRAKAKPSILGERQYDLDEIGFKYHLNDLAASLGLANLKTLKQRLKRRKLIAKKYIKIFNDTPGITLFEYSKKNQSSWWLFGMHVENRKKFIRAMKSRDISVSVVHQGIDKYSLFGGLDESLANQRKFDSTQIHIPVYDSLTDAQVDHVIKSIKLGW